MSFCRLLRQLNSQEVGNTEEQPREERVRRKDQEGRRGCRDSLTAYQVLLLWEAICKEEGGGCILENVQGKVDEK